MRRFYCLLIAITFIATPAFAQPLADKVPANPIFYFGWRGSEDLGPAYADSHLKAVLGESGIPAVFNDMIPRAIARVGLEDPQVAQVLRDITSVARPMWKHPCAFYLADVDLNGANPMPKIALLCKAGNDAQSVLAQLQRLADLAHKSPVPIRAFQSADIVAITAGYSDGEDPIALATSKPLNNDAAFTSALGNVQKDAVLTLYVNFEHAWTLIDDAVAKQNDADVKENWPKIRDAAGLPGLKRAIATGAFDGKDWMEAAFIETPGPRVGLLSLLDSQPISDDLLKLAPAESDRVMAGTFDLAKLLAVIRAGVAQVNPEAGQMVEKGIGAVSLYVGRDFQKEVLEPLGDKWLYYSSPNIAGRGFLGGIIVNQLDDAKKAESGLMATQIATFNTIGAFMPKVGKQKMTLRAQTMKADGLTINYLAVPLFSPAWSVSGGNLIVALFPQNVISANRFGKSGGKTILDNPNFVNVRKRLGAPTNVTGVSYVDLTQTVGEGYQGVVAMSRLALGIGDLFGVKSPEPVVPPLDVLLKHVAPSGGVSWVDDAGWHSRSVSSFPCAEVFGGGNQWVSNLFQIVPAIAPALNRPHGF